MTTNVRKFAACFALAGLLLLSGCAVEDDPNLPKYQLARREISDSPIKSQVIYQLIVSPDTSNATIEYLMRYKWQKELDNYHPSYHSHPTHIFVYVYTSAETWSRDLSHFVARLMYIEPTSLTPQIDFNEQYRDR